MTVPKTIEKYAREYVETKSQKAYQKVVDWLNKYTDADGVDIGEISIVSKPTGDKQFENGEYCEQRSVGCEGDSFEGYYYHKMRENDNYLKYTYFC